MQVQDKIRFIEEYLEKHQLKNHSLLCVNPTLPSLNPNTIDKIYKLYTNENINLTLEEEPEEEDSNYYLFIALYLCMKKKYELMKKFYKKAIEKEIEKGNIKAMENLGCYYFKEENYQEAKKYFIMGVELGDSNAIYNLGVYYYDIEKNYEEAKKYYIMAIKLGNPNAMHNLGYYYYNVEENYEEAKKNLLMAIECKHYKSLILFTKCFIQTQTMNELIDFVFKNRNIKEIREHYSQFIQFYINREETSEEGECRICRTENQILVVNDCFSIHHRLCISCYLQYDKCPTCEFEKHPRNKNLFILG